MIRETGVRTERREVRVDDPALSAGLNERLTQQLRQVIGAEACEVPVDRPRPSRGEPMNDLGDRAFGTSAALMGSIGFFAAISVTAIILTSVLNSFWFLGLAMFLDAVGLGVVALTVIRMTSVGERPDATTVADMQSEGIPNPERYFSDIVEEFRTPTADAGEHRHTTVEQDPAQASAEQRSAMTPTGGPSRAVGPGA